MTTVVGSQFDRAEVTLDGHNFQACQFRECTLIYNGGELQMSECQFVDCLWKFGGAALRTIQLFRNIYTCPGGKEQVDQVIDQIRGTRD